MKSLKFLFLLSFGMLLTMGSLQAQAKKSCNMPCTKAKTAQVETTDASTTPVMLVSQERATETKAVKNCDPKNCDPKNCPPGCDISQCTKGTKTAATGMKVANKTKPACSKTGTACCKGGKSAEKTKTSNSLKVALK